jgi:hypothetical protein
MHARPQAINLADTTAKLRRSDKARASTAGTTCKPGRPCASAIPSGPSKQQAAAEKADRNPLVESPLGMPGIRSMPGSLSASRSTRPRTSSVASPDSAQPIVSNSRCLAPLDQSVIQRLRRPQPAQCPQNVVIESEVRGRGAAIHSLLPVSVP